MIKLDSGNVLLKPSHRRQMMGRLRRSLRLGERLGDFALSISLNRTGRMYEARASVHDAAGDFDCRLRRHDCQDALRELVQMLAGRLHEQCLRRAVA